ncbi:MAG: hypothetical protein WBA69_20335 [Mycobacterium sp.]
MTNLDTLEGVFDARIVAASAAAQAAEQLGDDRALAQLAADAADAATEAEAAIGYQLWLHTADPEYQEFADYGAAAAAAAATKKETTS